MSTTVTALPVATVILRGVRSRTAESVVVAIAEHALPLAVEVTHGSPAFDHLGRLVHDHPGVMIGAGTIVTMDAAERALSAGCRFLLAPTAMSADVVAACHAAGALAVPGALTPTEILAAEQAGADVVKVFPASALPEGYPRDVQAPLGPVPLMAVGGVTPENAARYLDTGYRMVGVGSGTFPRRPDELTDAEIVAALRRLAEAVAAAVR